MRYHFFLNSIRKMVKTTKVFSKKLTVKFQSSTTVHLRFMFVAFLSLEMDKLRMSQDVDGALDTDSTVS